MGKHLVTATCYDKRGRILSKATNDYRKSHPIQAHFAKLSGNPEAVYLHAEIAALLRCSDDRPPHHIKIERYKKDGSPGLAKPCKACELALKAYGVKLITYTVG